MQRTSSSALKVLIVDDDKAFGSFVRTGLLDEGFRVTLTSDGSAGLRHAEKHVFDIIVLDVMLPSLDGFEVTRRLRMQNIRTPILLLTGRDAAADVVKGLNAGADDYLTKPFAFSILVARIRARTRTPGAHNLQQLRFADLFLDAEKHEASRGGRRLELTRTEFAILECLIRSAGRVVLRSRITEIVWGDREVSHNNLDVFIRFLRTKVDTPGVLRLLHTERGLGYSLREGSS